MRSGDTAGELTSGRPVLPRPDWRAPLAAVLLAAPSMIAGVVVWRRLAGAFARPIPDPAACAVVALALASGLTAHLLCSVRRGELRRAGSIASGAAALLPGLALGSALLSGGSAAALTCAGTLLAFTGAAVVATAQPSLLAAVNRLIRLERSRSRRKGSHAAHRLHQDISEEAAAAATAEQFPLPVSSRPEFDGAIGSADSAPGPGRRTQWMTRSVTPDGEERLDGAVTVEFGAGQRTAVAHVPFSPPFTEPPRIDCEVLEGAAVRVKVAAAYPYGARIEARQGNASDEPQTAIIGFRAVAMPHEIKARAH